jgi:hypothetical protein
MLLGEYGYLDHFPAPLGDRPEGLELRGIQIITAPLPRLAL